MDDVKAAAAASLDDSWAHRRIGGRDDRKEPIRTTRATKKLQDPPGTSTVAGLARYACARKPGRLWHRRLASACEPRLRRRCAGRPRGRCEIREFSEGTGAEKIALHRGQWPRRLEVIRIKVDKGPGRVESLLGTAGSVPAQGRRSWTPLTRRFRSLPH